jgi:ribosome-associated heat shock protein Hsp15
MSEAGKAQADDRIRLDKLLWFLRFAGSRAIGQIWAEAGHIRINGKRVVKPAAPVAVGDILTLPLGNQVRVFELTAIPRRRGPAIEAQSCYRNIGGASATDSQDATAP